MRRKGKRQLKTQEQRDREHIQRLMRRSRRLERQPPRSITTMDRVFIPCENEINSKEFDFGSTRILPTEDVIMFAGWFLNEY